MKKAYHWLTSNIGGVAVLFLLAFIPLYPKLPLINVIRTFVYIRLEDFIVAAVIGVYALWRLRQRPIIPKTPLTWPIIIFWIVGAVSSIFSILFIGPKLVGFFPHLVALNYLRRIEYMMLFFIAFDVFAKKKNWVSAVLWVLAGTTLGIIIYGLGEKFFGWPAFMTMNEQFAKGIPLRLPPTARIPSTFGGHYDLAAFVVLTLPILVMSIFAFRKIWQKAVFTLLSFGSLLMLLLTESRTSFLVYLVGISAALIWYKKKWYVVPVIIVSFIMLSFVSGASDRFYKTFRYSDVIIDASTGKPVGTLASLEGDTAVVQESQSPAVENLPTGSEYIGLPPSAPAVTATKSAQVKSLSFVSENLASGSGEIATVSGSFLIQKALVYDISITTRLQGEWPMALTAFERNILLGSGYSSVGLATDGDYIRMLGETGILGTLAFLGILLTAYVLFFKKLNSLEGYEKALVVGLFGGLVGLILNGILIDVFESSKVAFTLWLLLGVAMAVIMSTELSFTGYLKLFWNALKHDVSCFIYLLLGVVVLFGNSVSNYFVADDFTWLKWAASSSYHDVLLYFTQAQGFFYRPIPKLVYFVLYAIFWLKPEGYHIVSYFLYAGIAYLLFLIMNHTGVKRWLSLLLSLLFVTLSIHHENVFWISGQSSLLSCFFLLFAIYLYLLHVHKNGVGRAALYTSSVASLFLSMISYDGMLVAPIIYFAVAWGIAGKKDRFSAGPLILIPVYWLVRMASGAVAPSGDYGYSMANLPFNLVGNTVGYFVATFVGPKAVESWSLLREYLKLHKLYAAVGGGAVVVVLGYLVWIARKSFSKYSQAITWGIAALLSLVAYAGLGNMSERYALAFSGFVVLMLGAIFTKIGKKILLWVMIAMIAGVAAWNVIEVERVGGDWQKASDITMNTLTTMNTKFFPLKERKSFIFVNTPTRYGRAWVFPTGLSDALWHEFHFNGWDYITTNVSTPQEAFAVPMRQGYVQEVLLFDNNYALKRLIKVE